MIKNVIFDVYGTLISTDTGSVGTTAVIFGKYNPTHLMEDIYKR